MSKPALLFGDDPATLTSAAALLDAADVRLAGQSPIAAAADRLDRQIAVGLVWLECGATLPSDALLDRLARLAESGEAAVVACGPPTLIDPLYARLDRGRAQILIDPDDSHRAAALAVALARVDRPTRVSDVGRDNAVRLRQLSDEMGRIAATLARLSSTPDESGPSALRLVEPPKDAPPLSVDVVRSVIRARRLRARYFSEELFADPAWDMLLDLLQAELAQHASRSARCASPPPCPPRRRCAGQVDDRQRYVRRAPIPMTAALFVELPPAQASRCALIGS